ncbi:hypothetical protein [Paludisphaera sp.]|uniref:hypothetical protein n=1 Tax=Paludisphaera sp. TaxID=2017432 RepID=UPI00301C8231
MTYFQSDGEPARQEQFHGEIEEVTDRVTRIRPFDGGDLRSLPTDRGSLRPAPGGTYRLACSGAVVDGPRLLTSWMFTQDADPRYWDARPNHAPLLQSRVPTEWDFTYRWDEDRIRRAISLFGDEYIGRTLLLGLNVLDREGRLKRQEQHVGTIMVVDVGGILVAIDRDARTLEVPGDPAVIERAPPARYRLRSTGRVVRDPDYIAEYTTREEP